MRDSNSDCSGCEGEEKREQDWAGVGVHRGPCSLHKSTKYEAVAQIAVDDEGGNVREPSF